MLARSFLSFACASVLSLVVTAPRATAQCGPDGLDGGPCCTQTSATLPAFPAMTPDARFLCFDGCQTTLNTLYCANVGAPTPVGTGGALLCGVYNIRIRLRTCGTLNYVWNGSVKAHYSRNWQASSIAGTVNLNVWRFIVNGDFLPTPFLPNTPCDRPACLSQYTRVYFTGYVDYAFDCTANTWSVSFALSHECDGIHHAPGTVRPAPATGFHPGRSFTIVGPGSTFVALPTTTAQSNGTITQQAIRWNNWNTAVPLCSFEEPASGSLAASNAFCFCTTSGGAQYVATNITASSTCGSAISPSAAGMFLQKRIGRWNNAAQFPGVQFVLFDFGYLSAVNGCTGTTSLEWFEGTETIRGYLAYDFAGVPLGSQFEDLGSSNTSTSSAAIRIGAPHVVDCVLNFCMP